MPSANIILSFFYNLFPFIVISLFTDFFGQEILYFVI